jgi:hypothetical protein
MPKFVIEPHFRLQEWIAEEKGYFTAEGLDYEFREKIRATAGQHHDMGGQRVGAYQSFEAGRSADVSCACHWTVNVAASSGHGRLYADLYSVAPAGIFVAADSPIRDPADLAGVPISVGWQPDPEDLRKFFRALRRAQRDLDLRPDRYTHYYKNEFPERFHPQMDTRRWGPGERLVFEPYTKEAHGETFDWIARHGIFAEGGMGLGRYEDSVMSLQAAD